jgi:hypothetical protein
VRKASGYLHAGLYQDVDNETDFLVVEAWVSQKDTDVFNDDAEREYAYGPANGLPDTKFGTFPQSLMDEAKKKGGVVISMKNDWKRIFAFEK